MKNFLMVIAVIISMGLTIPSFANPNKSGTVPEQEHVEMLYPTVLVRVGSGTGSGTVIYSDLNENQEYESYVLTNWHVIQN